LREGNRLFLEPLEDPDRLIEQVGRRIAELRTRAGLTQAEVAEKLRTTVSNYQRIEHGLQNLTIKTAARIASAIGVSTASLFEASASRQPRRGRPKKRI
jgi:transcriptional regulator with XRE-family HTH domain